LPRKDLLEINRRDDVVQSSVTGFQSAISKCAALAQNDELDATARCFSEKYKPYQEALLRMQGVLAESEPRATGECASRLSTVRTSLGNLTTKSDSLNDSSLASTLSPSMSTVSPQLSVDTARRWTRP
jgi:hypothetical protein